MAEREIINTLERQLAKCEEALTEFSAIDAQLRDQRMNPRVADMIRVNRETIKAMENSMALIRERLQSARQSVAEKSHSTSPFESAPAPRERGGV